MQYLNRQGRTLGELDRFIGSEGELPLHAGLFSANTPLLRLGSRETESYGWEAIMDITREEGDTLQSALLKSSSGR